MFCMNRMPHLLNAIESASLLTLRRKRAASSMSRSAASSAPASLRDDTWSGESGQSMEELELGSVRRMDEGGLKGSSAFLLTRRKRNLKYSRSSSLISCKTAEEENAAQLCWQAIMCFP